eukprot:CAMPEP_0197628564 /NCGR_PEP_ID=MMETSP1338-20131121/6819_1 /TAXON_ID=43686 ORGANISM="Pelagodinium beii, Strain RCC1491" /NCGR_SAMPLE_ID=MMETSP1338 /ASSEMBLY_ACC=CAM_ASM_000754 /LENGTH=440 /DNA_ID=CAMNT_0043199547 /DNA_START=60 /DNA_END=1379 /DNA_ORIENTATION=+
MGRLVVASVIVLSLLMLLASLGQPVPAEKGLPRALKAKGVPAQEEQHAEAVRLQDLKGLNRSQLEKKMADLKDEAELIEKKEHLLQQLLSTEPPSNEDPSSGEDAEHAEGPSRGWKQWSWQAGACTGLICLCCVLPLTCACIVCCLGVDSFDKGLLHEAGELVDCQDIQRGYEPVEDSPLDLKRLLRREMRYVMLYPLLPLLGLSQTTCKHGAPLWVYVCFLPLLARAHWIEWRILRSYFEHTVSSILCSAAFVLGALDKLDWMTDGIFPTQAYKCDAEITEPFAASFGESWGSALAPLILAIRFWGLATFVLLVATTVQQAQAVYASEVKSGVTETAAEVSAADIAGFGAVANAFEQRNGIHDRVIIKGFIILAKVLLENALQLHLQASFFALTFDHTDGYGRSKVVASLSLSLTSALFKSALGIYTSLQDDHLMTKLW